MNSIFQNFTAYYCISTVVTLILALKEIYAWRCLMKTSIKSLLSRGQKKVLSLAAKLLAADQAFDDYFVSCLPSHENGVYQLGEDYVVVRTHTTHKTRNPVLQVHQDDS